MLIEMIRREDRQNGGIRAAAAAALALACALLLVIAAPAAGGACGGVKVAKPRKNVSRGPAPLAIGDSVMLLALPDLARKGYKANARGCRGVDEGIDVIRKADRHGPLPRLVTVALGADGSISIGQIRQMLRIIGHKTKLGLVAPLQPGGHTGHGANVVRKAAQRFDKRIRLLDWPNFSNGHPGWFQPDGLHLTFPGAAAYARLMSKALKNLPPPK
jgi:hypothetical protein